MRVEAATSSCYQAQQQPGAAPQQAEMRYAVHGVDVKG